MSFNRYRFGLAKVIYDRASSLDYDTGVTFGELPRAESAEDS